MPAPAHAQCAKRSATLPKTPLQPKGTATTPNIGSMYATTVTLREGSDAKTKTTERPNEHASEIGTPTAEPPTPRTYYTNGPSQ